MSRLPDPEIPADERLFRRFRGEWIDGDRVLDEAIDLQGMSCDRERYRDPRDLIGADYAAVGWVAAGNVPGDLQPEAAGPVWEFFAVDCPDDGNDAHCEIRVRRTTRRGSSENDTNAVKKRTHAVKVALRHALAQRFRVLVLE